jgi:membrane-associated phospholipid phosphatase
MSAMTAHSHAAGRVLPRGWGHLALQFAIWLGFYGAYQVARGAADQSVDQAFENGQRVIDVQRSLGSMIELPLQHAVEASSFLVQATSYTYWLSQFAVVGFALLWVYFRAHERFIRFRNTLILANLIGLVGYVVFPTAPPRMFPEAGFTDTLARHSTVTHESTIVEFAANPYAAMPSLHSADALIVGVVMALAVRSRWAKALWLAWPVWVWISVMATGNHFWLDIAAGVLVAVVAAGVVYRGRLLRRLRPAQ